MSFDVKMGKIRQKSDVRNQKSENKKTRGRTSWEGQKSDLRFEISEVRGREGGPVGGGGGRSGGQGRKEEGGGEGGEVRGQKWGGVGR
jgi:hypothetical protein